MKTSLIKPAPVEDVRGRKATDRSVFRGGAKTLVRDTRGVVRKAQDESFVRRLEKLVKRIERVDRPRSPEEATDKASTRIGEQREKKRRDKVFSLIDKVTRKEPEMAGATARRELSEAYQEATRNKDNSLIRGLKTIFANGKGRITKR